MRGALSERIDDLLTEANKLRTDIAALLQEVNDREGIEAIEGLADVPDDLEYAEALMRSVCAELELARQDAITGETIKCQN
ncbi:MAG TPA: hypothetical protein PLJ11_05055 [Methanomassiliicoccales archaeon]|jgi:hypothetical protein|nr:hypothetical protein [Methanomassiliicoccales archaeon]